MRRILSLTVAAGIASAFLVSLAGPAGAQTGDIPAFCAARIEANSAETKAENKAVIEKVAAAAPAAAVPAITAIRDGFAKKGDKFFNSDEGLQILNQLDAVVFQVCPGTVVPVTAVDYQFQGMPATLPAGAVKFKFTNGAPKENHELIVFKLNAQGATEDPKEILSMPEKKANKLFDQSSPGMFAYAPPGVTSYAFGNLSSGKYLYACFESQGGKKNGKPHAMLGMYGSFTVS